MASVSITDLSHSILPPKIHRKTSAHFESSNHKKHSPAGQPTHARKARPSFHHSPLPPIQTQKNRESPSDFSIIPTFYSIIKFPANSLR